MRECPCHHGCFLQLYASISYTRPKSWYHCHGKNIGFHSYGVPKKILSDQGHHFEVELLKQLCQVYDTEMSRIIPCHPEGNGQCERFNHTLHDLFHSLPPERKSKWPQNLPQIILTYNTSEHAYTRYTPYLLKIAVRLVGPRKEGRQQVVET